MLPVVKFAAAVVPFAVVLMCPAAVAAGGCDSARLVDITLEAAGYAPDRKRSNDCRSAYACLSRCLGDGTNESTSNTVCDRQISTTSAPTGRARRRSRASQQLTRGRRGGGRSS
eukprot:COSAG02_NODE_5526_length_4257_cov_3.577099_1_plen_114_part_00